VSDVVGILLGKPGIPMLINGYPHDPASPSRGGQVEIVPVRVRVASSTICLVHVTGTACFSFKRERGGHTFCRRESSKWLQR
jgi:hypothetical protein